MLLGCAIEIDATPYADADAAAAAAAKCCILTSMILSDAHGLPANNSRTERRDVVVTVR